LNLLIRAGDDMNKIETFKINFSISPEDDEASNEALSAILNWMDAFDERCGAEIFRDALDQRRGVEPFRDEFRDIFRLLFAFAQLDAVLAESKAGVLARNDSQKSIMELAPEYMETCKGKVPPVTLYEETGIPYYNTSGKTLSECLSGELEDTIKTYVAGYSPSVQVVMSHISFSDRLEFLSVIELLDQVVKEALAVGPGLSHRARLQVASELLLETGAEDPIITCLKDMRGYTVIEQVIS